MLYFVPMLKKNNVFPKITRPGEYVAFLNLKVPTMEGPAYVFLACDGFSEFAFNICTEPDESPESIIKAVYLLTENKDFARHRDQGFTLVFSRFEELSERLDLVVRTFNGKLMFNKNFHKKIAEPLVLAMNQYLRQGRDV